MDFIGEKELSSNGMVEVSFLPDEDDMRKFKEKALAAGIPYQTLLNSLVHCNVTGQIIIPDPV